MNWQKELKKIAKGRVRLNEPLSNHTTFGIGGRSECWVEPQDAADLKNILSFAKKNGLPVFIIGAGSNLLVKDNGVKGVVISLNQQFFKKAERTRQGLRVGAGLSLASLANNAQGKGLSGCEFLVGIPGTVGGALQMNAGVRGDCIGLNRYLTISDLVQDIEAVRYDGSKAVLRKKDLKFSYRASNLVNYIIICANLKLKPKDKSAIKKIMDKFWQYKKIYQELNRPNAGCIFRNPEFMSTPKKDQPLLSAGELIDLCGLKGFSYGDAVISRRHANFILNNGHARASDVLALMEITRNKVRQRFNLNLVPEIRVVGR